MRYFLLGFVLVCMLVVSIAGCRGSFSRRPPIELFPDMVRQPKLRPQTYNSFFVDQLSSRPPAAATVARGTPYEDTPHHTGRMPGTTNFVETIPVPVTAELLARGQQRYAMHCAVCHGAAGDGKGLIVKYQMVGMANFHDKRLVSLADGDIFNTITYGKNLMNAYGPNVDLVDRWAIIAYLRTLERSRLASLDDVPEAMRSTLKK